MGDGSVRCWGINHLGQLGSGFDGPDYCGTDAEDLPCSLSPVAVDGIRNAVQVSVGDQHSRALRVTGDVWCWGLNDAGQLGTNSFTGPALCLPDESVPCSRQPVPVLGLEDVTQLAASDQRYTCALGAGGSVWCWGLNSAEFGNGSTEGPSRCNVTYDMPCATMPVRVPDVIGATQVDTSTFHVCAAMADRSVECWGENLSGEIGVPDQLEVLFATPVAGLGEVLSVTTGGAHSCALLADRTVSCWGSNQLNQLGRTSAENSGRCPGTLYNTVASCSATPTPVAGLTNVVSVAAGSWHTCALIDDGTVKCWGANNFGQLGDGSIGGSVATPVTVSGLHGVVALSVGSFHSCALLDNGNVYCWGYNQFGQVGNGDTLDQAAPVRVNL